MSSNYDELKKAFDAKMNNSASYGYGGYNFRAMPSRENKEYNDTVGNGFFGHMKDAADAGFFSSLAGTARFASEFSPFGGSTFNRVANYLDEKVKQNTPLEALEGSDYFAAAVGNALGSGAAGALEGAVLLGAVGATGGAVVPAATAVRVYKAMRQTPALGQLVKATRTMWKSNFGKLTAAEIASSPIEATAEAGNLITEMRNEGYSDEEIRSAALQSARYNVGWLTVANMVGGKLIHGLGSEGVKAGLKGAVKAIGKGAVVGGTEEAIQEYGQSYIHDESKGVEFNEEEAEAAALQAFVGSAFLGGVRNFAKPYVDDTSAKKKVTKEQPEQEASDIDDIEDAKREDAQAAAEEVEAVAPVVDEEIATEIQEPKTPSTQETPAKEDAEPEQGDKDTAGKPNKFIEMAVKGDKSEPPKENTNTNKPKPVEAVEPEKKSEPAKEEVVANPESDRDQYGYKLELGEYKTNEKAKDNANKHSYISGKIKKTIFKKEDGTYSVTTVSRDKFGSENTSYKSFATLEEAEKYIEGNKNTAATAGTKATTQSTTKSDDKFKKFKDKRLAELNESAKTKEEAVRHFGNMLKKYHVAHKKMTQQEADKLVAEYAKELESFKPSEVQTAEVKSKILANLQKRQTELLSKVREGNDNSRSVTAKMNELIGNSGLSETDKKQASVAFKDALDGVVGGLRQKLKRKKGSEAAAQGAIKNIESRIANLDEQLRKGNKLNNSTVWGINQEIGKSEDLGLITKEMADMYYEKVDKVVRDAKQAEINATGGRKEQAAPKTETGKKQEPKVEVNKNQNNDNNGNNDGNKFVKMVNAAQTNQTNQAPSSSNEVSLLKELQQKTKEQLDELQNQKEIDFNKAFSRLSEPYYSAIDAGQLGRQEAEKALNRIQERLNELKSKAQGENNAPKEQAAPPNKSGNKFVDMAKAELNNEQQEDKQKESQEETTPPKETNKSKPNKFVEMAKGEGHTTDSEASVATNETNKQEEEVVVEDDDTPEVKAAKKKLFDGLKKILQEMGISITSNSQKVAEMIKSNPAYSNVYVDSQKRIWVTDKNGKKVHIKGFAFSDERKLIYICPTRLDPMTAVHEYTHIWNAIIKEYDPALWAKGVELAKKSSAWAKVKASHPHLKTDSEIANEVLALWTGHVINEKVNQSIKGGFKSTIQQWVNKYWKTIKRIFENFFSLNSKNLQELTFQEFGNLPIQSLFNKTSLTDLKLQAQKHSSLLEYDSKFRTDFANFLKTKEGTSLKEKFDDKDMEIVKDAYAAIGRLENIQIWEDSLGRDKKRKVNFGKYKMRTVPLRVVKAIQYFSKKRKGYQEITDADIREFNSEEAAKAIADKNLVNEFIRDNQDFVSKHGGADAIEKILRDKVDGVALHKHIQKAYGKDWAAGLDDEAFWGKLFDKIFNLKLGTNVESIATRYYNYLAGDNDGGAAFGVDVFAEEKENSNGINDRLRKAVVTKKPATLKEEIQGSNGITNWLKQQWKKLYRDWVDKNHYIKDLDALLEETLGRALSESEKIYNRIQTVGSNASGLITALVTGDERHIRAINSRLGDKKLKNVTMSKILKAISADKMNKAAPDYLKKNKFNNWVEAFGTYLGWRRLAEMAKLHREAYLEERAEWLARKQAYDAWVASGRVGENPQVAAYNEWEAYQKAKKNAKSRWQRNGKVGPDPSEELKAKWLATHKNEEAPPRNVGKEPEFEEYLMPAELTEKDVATAIKNAPAEFEKAAKLYYALNDNILTIMEDAGLISAELHTLLNTKYKDYCPMIRDFSDTAAVGEFIESITNGGEGIANVSSMIQKIKAEGSDRTIINPLESTVQTIAAVAHRAERNKAAQHLVKMMTSNENLKGYIEKAPTPQRGDASADPLRSIFTVMRNGKKYAYHCAPEYYQAIAGYNLPTGSIVLGAASAVARTLRTGATMSPSFIVRNIFRDTIFAGISSKNGFIPIVDTIRGAQALMKDKQFRADFEAAGVVSFNQYGSAESAYQNLLDMSNGTDFSVYEPKKIIEGILKAVFKGNLKEAIKTTGLSLEQLSSLAESATRAGEFKRARDNGATITEASLSARELTLDFSRSGIKGQEWNQYVPFFNACIQGGDKLVRLLYENPMGVSMKIGQYIVLPSLALWAMNHDEDWYEELEPSIKYTHWCLPNGIRIPKPQEAGVLFGGGIEAMLDQASQRDPRAMKEWADAVKNAIAPNVLPTVAAPIIEWLTNYSFFKGGDLVPQRLQRMPDELQYSSGTSELSKFIGKHTYVSPIKVDNLVRGYTGTMGMFLWQTPDWFAAEKQNLPAKKASEMQFVRDFNVTQANRTRFLNDFYELQQTATQQQAGYGKEGASPIAVKAIRRAGKQINDLNKQVRMIEMSDKWNPEQKRELIDVRKERVNKIAKLIVEKYGNDFL